jgi:hypothetical protein
MSALPNEVELQLLPAPPVVTVTWWQRVCHTVGGWFSPTIRRATPEEIRLSKEVDSLEDLLHERDRIIAARNEDIINLRVQVKTLEADKGIDAMQITRLTTWQATEQARIERDMAIHARDEGIARVMRNQATQ